MREFGEEEFLKMANLNNWNGMQRLHKVGYVF
jgi:hypothetical protein